MLRPGGEGVKKNDRNPAQGSLESPVVRSLGTVARASALA